MSKNNENHYMKQGDLEPPYEAQLRFRDGTIVNLTTASRVEFRMSGDDGRTKVIGDAEIVDPLEGTVRYLWDEGDSDDPGVYQGVFRVIWPPISPGGPERPQTFPSRDYKEIFIQPQSGPVLA